MGQLTPGATYIYERAEGIIYAREFGKTERHVVGYENPREYDPISGHRIDTIMDCDQLLVLSHGQLVEQGPPQQLATSGAGPFASMVTAARAAVRDMS